MLRCSCPVVLSESIPQWARKGLVLLPIPLLLVPLITVSWTSNHCFVDRGGGVGLFFSGMGSPRGGNNMVRYC